MLSQPLDRLEFEQFDRLDDDHRLGRAADQPIHALLNEGMDDAFQLGQGFLIAKDHPRQLGAVDLSLR